MAEQNALTLADKLKATALAAAAIRTAARQTADQIAQERAAEALPVAAETPATAGA